MFKKTVSRDRLEMNELSYHDILLECDKIGVGCLMPLTRYRLNETIFSYWSILAVSKNFSVYVQVFTNT